MKTLSVVFSFRNEEQNLVKLVNRVSEAIKRNTSWNYELVFVNDNSDDLSEMILKKLQEKYPIKIINLSRRFGGPASIIAGFNHAIGDCIIYMDSDLQDPPELIPELLKKYDEGFDIVHTVRLNRLGENKIKLLITKVAYKIINLFSEIKLIENAGDYKLISRRALEEIKKFNEHEPYVRGLVTWVGFKQGIVNYTREARYKGLTKFPLLSSVGPAKEFLRGITGFSMFPLYSSIIIGVLTLIFSLFLVLYFLYAKISGISVSGSTSILITIVFFSGVIITLIGVISLYIIRVFEEVRGRQRYIVKNIIDYKKKYNE